MARPKKDRNAVYSSTFAARLRHLMDSRRIKQQQLADFLGVSRQMITPYCDGTAAPDMDKLVKVAEFFHVTTDYLLGLSDVETWDRDKMYICEYTGLSIETVDELNHIASHNGKYLAEFLNAPILMCDIERTLSGIAHSATSVYQTRCNEWWESTMEKAETDIEEERKRPNIAILGGMYGLDLLLKERIKTFVESYILGEGGQSKELLGKGENNGNDPQENK